MDNNINLYSEIQMLKAGNQQSYYNIYNSTVNYVYKLIFDIIPDNQIAGNINQNVYQYMYSNISLLEKPEDFYNWISKIATTQTLNYLIFSNNFILEDVSDGIDDVQIFDRANADNTAFIPETILSDMEKQNILNNMIASFSPIDKVILQFYFYENLSLDEIAAKLNCSKTTVSSHIANIKKSLMNIVGTDSYDSDNSNVRLYDMSMLPILFLLFQSAVSGASLVSLFTASVGIGATAAGVATGAGAVTGISGVGVGSGISAAGTSAVGSGVASGVAGTSAVGAGVAGTASTGAAAVGMGIGTKIAIGLGIAACVGGGVAVTNHIINDKKADADDTATMHIVLQASYQIDEDNFAYNPQNYYEYFKISTDGGKTFTDLNNREDYERISLDMYDFHQEYSETVFADFYIENEEKLFNHALHYSPETEEDTNMTDRMPDEITFDLNGDIYEMDVTDVRFNVDYFYTVYPHCDEYNDETINAVYEEYKNLYKCMVVNLGYVEDAEGYVISNPSGYMVHIYGTVKKKKSNKDIEYLGKIDYDELIIPKIENSESGGVSEEVINLVYDYYDEILEDIRGTGCWPITGEEISINDISYIQYIYCDVDADGFPELLLHNTGTCMGDMEYRVYGYKPDTETFIIEHRGFPMFDIYANGVIVNYYSHNQTFGSYWPNNIFVYDNDTYKFKFQVSLSGWDKKYSDVNYAGDPFPDDIDADGNGSVYEVHYPDQDGYFIDDDELHAIEQSYYDVDTVVEQNWYDINTTYER